MINTTIINYFLKCTQNNNTEHVTIELLYELGHFVAVMKDDKSLDGYGMAKDIQRLFEILEGVIAVAEHHPSKIDLKDDLYKKKLRPLMERLRESYTQSPSSLITSNK
jgi:hypothetical protein